MANIDTLKGKLTSIANAIRQKTGRSALLSLDEMPPEILSIDGGGEDIPNPDDPLLLVDWDGTLLYSYTYEDAQQISEFPDPPTHEGLTFQSWNWTEVIAKTWLQNHRGEQLKVGATYTPTDGQDHNFWRSPRINTPSLIYMQHSAQTSFQTSAFRYFYSLANISLPQGVTIISSYLCQSCLSLNEIVIPKGVTIIGDSAFNGAGLTDISLPDSLTSINSSAFAGCSSLRGVNLPNSLTSIGYNAFSTCGKITTINLPSGITRIESSTFSSCYSLYKIDILSSITYIGNYAFQYCHSLMDIIVRGKPTLGGSDVFYDNMVAVNANRRYYVHRSDLAWFSTATNWSAIYGNGKIVAAADYIEYLQSIGVDTSDFEGE